MGGAGDQASLTFDEGKGLSTEEQAYDHTAIINAVRHEVDLWRKLPQAQWRVTPETARLLEHWRNHRFAGIRPFFCQVEAAETAIWLTEVAPQIGKNGQRFLDHLAKANGDANPELMRLALKLATGAGKTTVMAMLIAWQTINAVRHPGSKRFTRGFLLVAPGITIKDRLRVLQPNDPDSNYASREIVPRDMLPDLDKARIVITNYHAFKLRERIEISKGGRRLLEGRTGEALQTLETEGQMLQRVMPELMGMKHILAINDEAHHCYREKPPEESEEDLTTDEKAEAKENNEAARLWISGLEAVNRKLGLQQVIDELIKTSANPEEARQRMLARRWQRGMVGALLGAAGAEASRPEDLPKGVDLLADGYQLTEVQAQNILDMRLHRLTGLEQEKLTDEYRQLLDTIRGLIEILEQPGVLMQVNRTELENLKEEFGDARRSEIRASEEDLDILDLIAPEDVVVTLSHAGYAKRQPATTYRAQRRGGKGGNAAATKDEDFIDQLWLVNTHDTLLTFTSNGRVFWLSVHQLPDAGPNARGRPIINWIPLEEGEKVEAVLPVREYEDGKYVFFATRGGTVKKTALTEFAYRLARGKIAINLDEGDALVGAALTDGECDIMLFASNGKAVHFDEGSVRSMGRTATGMRGMRLPADQEVRSLIVIDGEGDILTASERGYGKRTEVTAFPKKGRGTQGVIALKTTDRNGQLVGAIQLSDHHDVLLISDGGTLVRTPAAHIAQVGRNTQGVTLMRVQAGEKLQAIERLDVSLDDADAESITSVDADSRGEQS